MPKKSSKPEVLVAATVAAKKRGLHTFTRADVGHESGMAESTVSYHFGTMKLLRRAVVAQAVRNVNLAILVETNRESYGIDISDELKEKIAQYVVS